LNSLTKISLKLKNKRKSLIFKMSLSFTQIVAIKQQPRFFKSMTPEQFWKELRKNDFLISSCELSDVFGGGEKRKNENKQVYQEKKRLALNHYKKLLDSFPDDAPYYMKEVIKEAQDYDLDEYYTG